MARTTRIAGLERAFCLARLARIAATAAAATALLTLVYLALAGPAEAKAKTYTFGIRLDHEPSNSTPPHNCREDGSDDPTPACTRVAISEGRAAKHGLRAPRNGTIIKLRVRAGAPGQVTFRLARLRGLGFDPAFDEFRGFGRGAGTGPTVQVQGRGFDEVDPIEEFPARLKVRKGDYLAIDSTSTSALYCSGGGKAQLIFDTPLGSMFQPSSRYDGCELMVQAVMKADAPKAKSKANKKKAKGKKKAAKRKAKGKPKRR